MHDLDTYKKEFNPYEKAKNTNVIKNYKKNFLLFLLKIYITFYQTIK